MSPRQRSLAAFALVLALAAGLVVSVRKATPSELRVYTLAAERMMGGEPVYRVGELKPFTYPPFFALPFVPLALLPEPLHKGLFFLLNAGMLGVILAVLARRVRPLAAPPAARSDGPRLGHFWLAVGLVAGWHVNTVFEKQTHDFIVFLLLALCIDRWAAGRDGAAGVLAGLATACKATPALFVLPFLLQRRWRALFAMGLSAIAASFVPDLVFPASDGQSWAVTWYHDYARGVQLGESAATPGEWTAWNILNQNLAGTVYRLSTPVVETVGQFDVSLWAPDHGTVRALTTGVQVAVLALLVLACRGGSVGPDGWRAVGIGGATLAAMVLLSPWSSKTHFCVLLVPVAFCLGHLFFIRPDRLVTALMVSCGVIGLLTAKDVWGRPLVNALLARGSVTWCALLCLVASVRILLQDDSQCANVLAEKPAHPRAGQAPSPPPGPAS